MSQELHNEFPDIALGCEWFCKGYLEAKFASDDFDSEIPEPSVMYITLLKLVPDSYLGFACKGVDELACNEFVAACDSLSLAVRVKPSYGIAWYLLTQAQVWVHRFADAEWSARQALQYWTPSAKNTQGINNCKFWLAQALSYQESDVKLKEALRIADDFIFDNPNNVDFLPILIRASIQLKDTENYEKYSSLLSKTGQSAASQRLLFQALWHKQIGELDEFERTLEKAMTEPDSFEIYLEHGRLSLAKGNLKEALKSGLLATKLCEWCPENYYLLGCIFQRMGDISKAKRCYQKAFHLRPTYAQAGMALSDALRQLKMEVS